jgi:hypothetical protein
MKIKHLLSLLFIVAVTAVTFGQVDSTQIMNTINTGTAIIETLHPSPWIPGVSNETVSGLLGFLAMTVISIIHRFQTIRIWKKKGILPPNH